MKNALELFFKYHISILEYGKSFPMTSAFLPGFTMELPGKIQKTIDAWILHMDILISLSSSVSQ